MSFSAQSWAWDQQCRSGVAKSVLLYLANCSDTNGECFPSIPAIARKVQHGEAAVKRALHHLETDGQVEREARHRRTYRFRLPVVAIADPVDSESTPHAESVESDSSPGGGYELDSTPSPTGLGIESTTAENWTRNRIPLESNPRGNPITEEREERKKVVLRTTPATSVAEPKLKSSPKRKPTLIPADWKPTDADRTYAISLGLDPELVAEDHVAYWSNRCDAKARKLDWSKAYQTTVRMFRERRQFQLRQPGDPRQPTNGVERPRPQLHCGWL
jgi:Helix-turn-helix domain